MIRIVLLRSKDGFEGLRSVGHSGIDYGLQGENIVCASVSVLLETLYFHCKRNCRFVSEKRGNGNLEFILAEEDFPKPLVQESFRLIQTGLEELQARFPEEIQLLIGEKRDGS